jgi:hypothetical protein
MKRIHKGFFELWYMPVLLAFVSMAGLVMAILGTGFWHLLSWAALSYPIYIMVKFGRKFFA